MSLHKTQMVTGLLLQKKGLIHVHHELVLALMSGLSKNGSWTVFTGDQLGTLFASWTLDAYRSSGKPVEKLAMVASTVSSKMIAAIAATEGFKFVECLTGLSMLSYVPTVRELPKVSNILETQPWT
jgi:phosphomannomutase